jgi:hypothetical protein
VSDGRQSLHTVEFNKLMKDLRRIAAAVDRYIAEAPVKASVDGRVDGQMKELVAV